MTEPAKTIVRVNAYTCPIPAGVSNPIVWASDFCTAHNWIGTAGSGVEVKVEVPGTFDCPEATFIGEMDLEV